MNINKICIMLIISIFAFSGIISFGTSSAETWVSEDPSATSYKISHLTATITVTVKNTNDHVQYFKMSQVYQGSLTDNSTIKWLIDWTDPQAVKMVKSRSPELGGDYGWPIKAGETKTVRFKLDATGMMGGIPTYIMNAESTDKNYWPLINEPGLEGSWFQPNELEILNPTLDIKKWTGHYTFRVTNYDDKKVYGIVRAPIAPTGSKLTSSSPDAFIDDASLASGGIAAWNVVMNPDTYKDFSYTYVWPKTSSSSSTAKASSALINAGGSSGDSTVPSKTTGVPYGLFVVGTLVAVAGVAYARFMR
ncbi:MAG: hypothetical protein Q8M97_07730 [Methanobacteriaceae archaeon]|nr:hypothetical protein [Methanobacteriaceae archaeon]